MRALNAQPRAAKADDDPPTDIDEFRMALARRIVNFMKGWKRCRYRLCKRAHACRGARMQCDDDKRPPMTPAQEARAKAKMFFALQREVARRGMEVIPANASALPATTRRSPARDRK
jgi:hypothetical protein